MWRGWFLHNDAIFGSGKETITSSVMFMVNYNATLRRLSLKENKGADEKGKAPLDSYLQEDQTGKPRSQSRRDKEGWKPSKTECVKLNTDAGFCWDSGCASASIVVRDHTGTILLTAWKTLRRCGSPEEAEVEACLQGISLVEEWIKQPTVIESDSQLLIKVVESRTTNRSSWNDLVAGIRAVAQLMREGKAMKSPTS
jgi:ribonuclease HI